MQAATPRAIPLEQLAAKIRQVWGRCHGEAEAHTYSQVDASFSNLLQDKMLDVDVSEGHFLIEGLAASTLLVSAAHCSASIHQVSSISVRFILTSSGL